MSVLPPKLSHIWALLPSGAKKMQTLLQPSASGESAFFWLLQARIPRRELPSAAGLLHTSPGCTSCSAWESALVLNLLPLPEQGLECVVLLPKGPRSHRGACQVPHAIPLLWEHGDHQLLLADPQVGLEAHQLKGPCEVGPLGQVPREQEFIFSSPSLSQALTSSPSFS